MLMSEKYCGFPRSESLGSICLAGNGVRVMNCRWRGPTGQAPPFAPELGRPVHPLSPWDPLWVSVRLTSALYHFGAELWNTPSVTLCWLEAFVTLPVLHMDHALRKGKGAVRKGPCQARDALNPLYLHFWNPKDKLGPTGS